MKFVSWLLTILILMFALCFALNNRQDAAVSLWPFGLEVVAPLYLLSLGTLFLGLLLGAAIGWMSHLPHRMEARRLRRAIADLHEKFENLPVAPAPNEKPEGHADSPSLSRGRFFGSRP